MTSKNKLAKAICGTRPTSGVSIDFPDDFGYVCPKCGNSLEWSEYNTFCWCPTCNLDVPTCLCMPELDKATNIYLNSVNSLKEKP